MKRILIGLLLGLATTLPCIAQQSGGAARLVSWQPKPGMDRDFEEGYKRHLLWHRKNADTWVWHGWNIVTGDRVGYFVDGSFFHPWTDLDNSVKPAEDRADNDMNVEPYATVRDLAVIESLAEVSNLSPEELKSPLMTFLHVGIAPGSNGQFEAAFARALRRNELSQLRRLVFRPASGKTEYLVMIPAAKQLELAAQQVRINLLLQELRGEQGSGPMVIAVRNELGRYRPDLSYGPQ